MVRNRIAIHVTNKCNARCEICGIYCGPDKSLVFDQDLMLDVIDQAGSIPEIVDVYFTGGEPMLYPDLVVKGAQRARKHKMGVVIVTNGYWGKWNPRRLLSFFKDAQPSRIHFSSDTFHRDYIDDEALGKAVAFTYAMGVGSHISINQMRIGPSGADFFNCLGTYKHLNPWHVWNMTRLGRATQFRPEDFFEPRQTQPARCIHDQSYGLTWTGVVLPCCVYEGFYGVLALGDLHDTSLAEMTDNPVMRLVRLLETEGFSSLVEAACRVTDSLGVDRFSMGCTVCHALFKDIGLVRRYAPLIANRKVREALKACLDFIDKRGLITAADWVEDDTVRRVALKRPGKAIVVR